jgi:hypothetical protein
MLDASSLAESYLSRGTNVVGPNRMRHPGLRTIGTNFEGRIVGAVELLNDIITKKSIERGARKCWARCSRARAYHCTLVRQHFDLSLDPRTTSVGVTRSVVGRTGRFASISESASRAARFPIDWLFWSILVSGTRRKSE